MKISNRNILRFQFRPKMIFYQFWGAVEDHKSLKIVDLIWYDESKIISASWVNFEGSWGKNRFLRKLRIIKFSEPYTVPHLFTKSTKKGISNVKLVREQYMTPSISVKIGSRWQMIKVWRKMPKEISTSWWK